MATTSQIVATLRKAGFKANQGYNPGFNVRLSDGEILVSWLTIKSGSIKEKYDGLANALTVAGFVIDYDSYAHRIAIAASN